MNIMEESKRKIDFWMIVSVIIVVVLISLIIIGPQTKHYTMAEWQSVVYEWDVLTTYAISSPADFPGLEIGDRVKITGIITEITYDSTTDGTILYVDDIEFYWQFEGDLSNMLDIEDDITISLSIEYNEDYYSPSEYIAEVNSDNQILASSIKIES